MNTSLLNGTSFLSSNYLAPITLFKGVWGTFVFPESLSGMLSRLVSSGTVFRETLTAEVNWYMLCSNLTSTDLNT